MIFVEGGVGAGDTEVELRKTDPYLPGFNL